MNLDVVGTLEKDDFEGYRLSGRAIEVTDVVELDHEHLVGRCAHRVVVDVAAPPGVQVIEPGRDDGVRSPPVSQAVAVVIGNGIA